MIKFDEFKNEIIQDNNYYKNDRTIDYYAGLSRSDESLLSFLIEKLQNFFEPVQQIYEEINVDEKCIGRICVRCHIGCPPAILPIVPGEVINAQTIIVLMKYDIKTIHVLKNL